MTHNDTAHSVGLLWTSDQLVAETSTWQNTTLTTDKYPCPRWDLNHDLSRWVACGRSPAEIVGSNPTGGMMFVCCECRVLSGRGLCDELITRPEESYRMCCVVVCHLETSRIGVPYTYDISSLRVKTKLISLLHIFFLYIPDCLKYTSQFYSGTFKLTFRLMPIAQKKAVCGCPTFNLWQLSILQS